MRKMTELLTSQPSLCNKLQLLQRHFSQSTLLGAHAYYIAALQLATSYPEVTQDRVLGYLFSNDILTSKLISQLEQKSAEHQLLIEEEEKKRVALTSIIKRLGLTVQGRNGYHANEELVLDSDGLKQLKDFLDTVLKTDERYFSTLSTQDLLSVRFTLFPRPSATLLKNIQFSRNALNEFHKAYREWLRMHDEITKIQPKNFGELLTDLKQPHQSILSTVATWRAEAKTLETRADDMNALLTEEQEKKYQLGQAMRLLNDLIYRRANIEIPIWNTFINRVTCLFGEFSEMETQDPDNAQNHDALSCELAFCIQSQLGGTPTTQAIAAEHERLSFSTEKKMLHTDLAQQAYGTPTKKETTRALFDDKKFDEAKRSLAAKIHAIALAPAQSNLAFIHWLFTNSQIIDTAVRGAYNALVKGNLCPEKFNEIVAYVRKLEALDATPISAAELADYQEQGQEHQQHIALFRQCNKSKQQCLEKADASVGDEVITAINYIDDFANAVITNHQNFIPETLLPRFATETHTEHNMYERYLAQAPEQRKREQSALREKAAGLRARASLTYPSNTELLQYAYHHILSDATNMGVSVQAIWLNLIVQAFLDIPQTPKLNQQHPEVPFMKLIFATYAQANTLLKLKKKLIQALNQPGLTPTMILSFMPAVRDYTKQLQELVDKMADVYDFMKNLPFPTKEMRLAAIKDLQNHFKPLHQEHQDLEEQFSALFKTYEDYVTAEKNPSTAIASPLRNGRQ